MKNPFEQYPVIEFKDIKKGDTIAWVPKYSDTEFSNASIGVAHKLLDANSTTPSWRTDDNWVVSWDEKDAKNYLIDRPKPELPTEGGAVIYIKKYDGVILETPAIAIHDGSRDTVYQWLVPGGDKIPAIDTFWPTKALIEDFSLAEVKEVVA